MGVDVHRTKALNIVKLVGGDWNHGVFMTFHILGISSSQLTFIFFRGVGIPPTRKALKALSRGPNVLCTIGSTAVSGLFVPVLLLPSWTSQSTCATGGVHT